MKENAEMPIFLDHIWKYSETEFFNIDSGESCCRYTCERCGMDATLFTGKEDQDDLAKKFPHSDCGDYLIKSIMEK